MSNSSLYLRENSLYFFKYSCCKADFSFPAGITFISSRIATNSSLELATANLEVILAVSTGCVTVFSVLGDFTSIVLFAKG